MDLIVANAVLPRRFAAGDVEKLRASGNGGGPASAAVAHAGRVRAQQGQLQRLRRGARGPVVTLAVDARRRAQTSSRPSWSRRPGHGARRPGPVPLTSPPGRRCRRGSLRGRTCCRPFVVDAAPKVGGRVSYENERTAPRSHSMPSRSSSARRRASRGARGPRGRGGRACPSSRSSSRRAAVPIDLTIAPAGADHDALLGFGLDPDERAHAGEVVALAHDLVDRSPRPRAGPPGRCAAAPARAPARRAAPPRAGRWDPRADRGTATSGISAGEVVVQRPHARAGARADREDVVADAELGGARSAPRACARGRAGRAC